MKNCKTVTFLLIFCICALLWNAFMVFKYKKMYKLQEIELERSKNTAREIRNAVIKANDYSMRFQGKTLYLNDISKIFPNDEAEQTNTPGPRLVLIFSELGCNVCQDIETEFAVGVAKKFGGNSVLVIVQADSIRYAKSYIRTNRVNFPVYYCKEDDFLVLNDISSTPMIFVIDEDNRIVASHFPIAGQPAYSEPVHNFCLKYLEQYVKGG